MERPSVVFFDNLNLDQIRTLGVWLNWAEAWALKQHALRPGEPSFWPMEVSRLAAVQSQLRRLYEEKTGAPPHRNQGLM